MDWKKRYEALTGKEVDLCPLCRKGHMVTVERLLPGSPDKIQMYL